MSPVEADDDLKRQLMEADPGPLEGRNRLRERRASGARPAGCSLPLLPARYTYDGCPDRRASSTGNVYLEWGDQLRVCR